MDEKKIIEGTAEAVAHHLPKTTTSIDMALSSIVNIFDVLLSPFQMLKEYKDFKIDQFKKNLKEKVGKIPENRLKDKADLNIVGPTLEALKYTIFEDDLREMFENLLASSLDKKEDVFPSFIDIIRQLSSDEAKLLKYISTHGRDYPLIDVRIVMNGNKGYHDIITNFTDIGFGVCQKPEIVPTYLVNLSRFGIIDIPFGVRLADESHYERLISHAIIQKQLKQNIENIGKFDIYKTKFYVTDFGFAFLSACVKNK